MRLIGPTRQMAELYCAADVTVLPTYYDPSSKVVICLLYTSDAADERSSVDLGGRRIIKKKKEKENWSTAAINQRDK